MREIDADGLLGRPVAGRVGRRICRAPKHEAGLHLNRLTVSQVPLEFPFSKSVGDGLRLIGKRAEKVNVFHFAFFIDDDSHRNRVEPGGN